MIPDKDLRITRLRNGGGNGGQNKNKVETAIRLEHAPTGIVITANTERSQKDNLREALRRLEEQLASRESRRRARAAGIEVIEIPEGKILRNRT